MRLVNGASEDEGRVEVCLSGRWGTVCSSGWDSTSDGHVVCTQLGYQTAGVADLVQFCSALKLFSLQLWEHHPL